MSPRSKQENEIIRDRSAERLLKAALKIFILKGYNASSVSEIAKEADVSKGLAYHYFDSKEEILVALAEKRLQEGLPLIESLESVKDPFKRLELLVDIVLKELVEKTDELRFFNALYLSADGVRAIEKAMIKYKDQFERVFSIERQLQTDLGFSNADLEATFLRSTLQGISLEYMLDPKHYPLNEVKTVLMSRYESKKKK